MSIPPLLLAAALLLWGWRSELLPVAVALAAVLELARLAPWRFRLAQRDYNRVADATAVAFLLAAVYAFDEHGFHGIYRLLAWLPMLLFALALVQVYGSEPTLRYTALFYTLRRAHARGLVGGEAGVDFRRPYLGACLLAATVQTEAGAPVIWALLAIVGWLLWANRSRRYGTAVWLCALAVLVAVGVGAQMGLLGLRRAVEPAVVSWFQERMWSHRDPFRAYTAIGHIGRLKQSDAIVLRVTPDAAGRAPALLRESAYQTFSKNVWLAGNATFEPISSDLEGTTWRYHEPPASSSTVTIGVYFPRGRGLVPLPNGSWQMSSLPAEEVELNPLGAVRVVEGPGFAEFEAHYAQYNRDDEPPATADLRVPEDLRPLMRRVLAEMGASHLAPASAARRIESFFDEGFSYSLLLKRATAVSRPLHDFLLETRRGHCEYYATATVMLLRAAGVPARYASGYSVQEWDAGEQRYLVRRRHSHSWALAWLDGAWRDVDTTPAVWVQADSADAPWWEPGSDLLSLVWYHWSRWRWQVEEEGEGNELLWLILPLVLLLAWRLRRSERVSTRRRRAAAPRGDRPGMDSELFRVEQALRREGLQRGAGEPLAAWLARLAREGRLRDAELLTDEALALHRRHRFDPRGITAEERIRLRAAVQAWLSRPARGPVA